MNETVTTILDTIHVGAMATVNADSTPSLAPLHVARLDDQIVWISDPNTRHVKNALRTGAVEFVIWNKQKQAVFLHTTARVAEGEDEARALEAYAKKFGNFRPGGEAAAVYLSPIGALDENSTTQNVWHFIASDATYSV